MEDFQKLLVKGPFELLLLSETEGHFRGEGFEIKMEADELQVKTMSATELSFNFKNLKSFDIRKSNSNGR
jgi:hypothetical protein